ncbi:MAG: histidine phosphatase family protein [bacterium]|nr:histidine phosphatase family protein [bacterium]
MQKTKEFQENQNPQGIINSVLIGRHFDDVDDLTNGLDTSLKILSTESQEILDFDAREIIENNKTKGIKKVLIISSPKQRAESTSRLIKQKIKDIQGDTQVQIRIDSRFSELYHGKIILPENYKPGRRIDFLQEAWKIFWAETFTEEGDYNNFSYQFGDPINIGDGQFKYPKIVGNFLSYGENYKDLSVRYYEAILEHFNNKQRIKKAGINVVVIAHSATLSILTELQGIANDFLLETMKLDTGDLMKTCWKRYLDRIKVDNQELKFGMIKPLYMGDINDEAIDFLRKELEFLKNT